MRRFIAVDWGTTNRRAWLIDRQTGVVAACADDKGLLSIATDGFATAAQDIRNRLGDWPMLLAGMVGSDRGWHNVPYVQCPADVGALTRGVHWIGDNSVGIVPGVCQTGDEADVMRGEEVQALGAVALRAVDPNGLVCHPGTHSKWVRLHKGQISGFRTMMTGEIYSLLRNGSILSAQMQDEPAANASFEEGLKQALGGAPLLSALFRIRAHHMLSQRQHDGASYASGLMIGSDVRAGIASARPAQAIAVIGRKDLSELYARAIERAGFTSRSIGDGDAFVAGMCAIVDQLEDQQDSI